MYEDFSFILFISVRETSNIKNLIALMSERKAINKYYPPDYDPSKVTKVKKPTKMKVRLMSPFSMRCLTCDEYISSSRKFNATKDSTGDSYMGVKIYRFTLLCPICNAKIIFRTDPQNSGFELESGALRNFQKKVKPAVIETTEQTLERLLKESKEDSKYQEMKESRKKDPFAKNQVEDNLELKLQEQQRQNEINDHLEYLKAKNEKIQNLNSQEIKLTNKEDELINAFNKFQKERSNGRVSKVKVERKVRLSKADVKAKTDVKDVEVETTEKEIKAETPPPQSGLDLGYSSDSE